MTKGNNIDGCKCPHCKAVVLGFDNFLDGFQRGEIREGIINCPNCSKAIYIWAREAIAIDMEKLDKVK